jgi:DNA-binding response OmpR family regulator
MRKTIFVIDDDRKLNELLTEYLGRFGYSVKAFMSPRDGIRQAGIESPDLVILDVMLSDTSGFEVLKSLRERHRVPVIMLTARGEVSDRVLGLELGADDYLPKPFEPRELVARIQAVLRRRESGVEDSRLAAGDLVLAVDRLSASRGGVDLELTGLEFALLDVFVRNPGRVFNRDQLAERLRGSTLDAFNRSIDILVSRLRQKLDDDPESPRYIKTVRGYGYLFIPQQEDAGGGP